jgi:flagellar biosynthetic protein FliO
MEIARQFGAVLFVLALLGAAVWVLRRYGMAGTTWKTRQAGSIEILQQVALGPGHRLHLVRVADQAILIATHASGSTVIERVPSSAVVTAGAGNEVRP